MEEILASIVDIFQQSTLAYKNYIAGGKTFRYAQELKRVNTKAINLLQKSKTSFPPVFFPHADALIHHYSVWSKKWEEHAMLMNPGPDDEFAFENDVTFPREAAMTFEKEYARLNPPAIEP